MKLKAVLESLEGLDEALHGFYAESDGAYHLQIDGLNSHPAVKGLSSALSRAKTQAGELKADAEAWRELKTLRGEEEELTPETVHTALEAKGGDADETKIQERIRAGVEAAQAKHQREIEKATTRATKLEAALRGKTVDADLQAAIAKAGVIEKYRPAVLALLKSQNPEMVEDGEKFVGMFKADPDGIPRDIPIDEYVSLWKESDAAAPYLPAQGGGSGAGGSGGGGGGGGAAGFVDGNDPLAIGRAAEKIAAGEASIR